MDPNPNNKVETYEILGIGAAVLDYVIPISDEILSQIPGEKGGTLQVDYETFERILSLCSTPIAIIPGGSTANTIRGLAHFGHKCAIFGTIGTDNPGKQVQTQLAQQGIESLFQPVTMPTTQVLLLITPDKQRTMRVFFGASQQMKPEMISAEIFHNVRLVHIEGYTLHYSGVTERTMKLAKEAGAIISFDLGSFEIVREFREILAELLPRYVDILFANEAEVQMLTGRGPELSCNVLKDICNIAVVLMGEKGCLVGYRDKSFHCPAIPAKAVDTTGAGDLFASGFIHGYLQGLPLEECARFGAITGSTAIQYQGAILAPEIWDTIKKSFVR